MKINAYLPKCSISQEKKHRDAQRFHRDAQRGINPKYQISSFNFKVNRRNQQWNIFRNTHFPARATRFENFAISQSHISKLSNQHKSEINPKSALTEGCDYPSYPLGCDYLQ